MSQVQILSARPEPLETLGFQGLIFSVEDNPHTNAYKRRGTSTPRRPSVARRAALRSCPPRVRTQVPAPLGAKQPVVIVHAIHLLFEVVMFSWTSRPGGEPFYGGVQQGAAGQEDQDGVRHEHHGPSTQARSCGMIGDDGINDESNKTSPLPSVHLDLPKYNSYDNVMAESVNGAYKTMLIWRCVPFSDLSDLKLTTFRWVSW